MNILIWSLWIFTSFIFIIVLCWNLEILNTCKKEVNKKEKKSFIKMEQYRNLIKKGYS